MKLNKIIKVLIFSDFALLSGFGFVTPIFAVFLTERIVGGNVRVAGYAAAIYLIVYSLAVLPISKYLDKNHGEKDDLWVMIVGNILATLAIFAYIFSRLPWHIYILQAIYGLGMAMNSPGYNAIFTRHISKGKEAFNWSVRSALIGVGGGVAGALGGIVADKFGFNTLFVGVAVFVLVSALIPLLILKNVSTVNKKTARILPVKGQNK